MAVSWKLLSNSPGSFASAMWLMQDGSILANLINEKQLVALFPDEKGSYANGWWSGAVGNFLLEKLYFASAVLSDGRLVACGGEYSGNPLDEHETNFCEIYDPVAKLSKQFPPPMNWGAIGDSPSVVLNDGTFLLGDTQNSPNSVALLNPSTLTWTFGGGDNDNEQGFVLLQTGAVLTAYVYNQTSLRYEPALNEFVLDANPPVMLGAGGEIGPGITLMDGRVIWFGATGHTCIYTPGAPGQNGTWVQGPDLPITQNGDQLVAADVGAILEPNGKVLLMAAGKTTPWAVLEYDPVQNSFGPLLTDAPSISELNETRMLLLPNGHGLVSVAGSGQWYDLTFDPGGDASWAPTVTSFPATVTGGTTVTLAGIQLCGLSECQSFGDDNQQAENYPMVRFVDSNGNVTYARAHDVSTRSIAPGMAATVLVDIPYLAPGTYTMYAVAMGIPSQGVSVVVRVPSPCQGLAKDVWHLIATVPVPDIPLTIRELLRKEILGCEQEIGVAETNSLLAALFPPQPPERPSPSPHRS